MSLNDRAERAQIPEPMSVHGAPMMAVVGAQMPTADRYEFGANWRRFLRDAGPDQILAAERSLLAILGPLQGRSLIDVGCGSGLFSLAALRLGAERVHSFDFDPLSVACTEALRASRHGASNWSIDHASILDKSYVDALGQFDVVYAWGVLHHTGAMWDAIHAVTGLVKPGGTLVLAIYNRSTGLISSQRWLWLKRQYNKSGSWVRRIMEAAQVARWSVIQLRQRKSPLRELSRYAEARGMTLMTDVRDWLGGLPYEYATAEEVVGFLQPLGFTETRRRELDPSENGCNEFVLTKDRSVDVEPAW
jgi:2-polyprenyl-3-methyl-5-hydroxy-6-metoxy-1,4-benzoquinol methylase